MSGSVDICAEFQWEWPGSSAGHLEEQFGFYMISYFFKKKYQIVPLQSNWICSQNFFTSMAGSLLPLIDWLERERTPVMPNSEAVYCSNAISLSWFFPMLHSFMVHSVHTERRSPRWTSGLPLHNQCEQSMNREQLIVNFGANYQFKDS